MSGSQRRSAVRRAVVALLVGAAMGVVVAAVVPREPGASRRASEPSTSAG